MKTTVERTSVSLDPEIARLSKARAAQSKRAFSKYIELLIEADLRDAGLLKKEEPHAQAA